MTKNEILQRVRNLRVDQAHGPRAPYKPLLLLFAIAKLQDNERQLHFPEVEKSMKDLCKSFAPPRKSGYDPRLPYLSLERDGILSIPNIKYIVADLGPNRRLPVTALRKTSGELAEDVWRTLRSDQTLTSQIVQVLLDGFFPVSLHQELSDRIGFALPDHPTVELSAQQRTKGRQRRSDFRTHVLRAYEQRCAVTGFHCLLDNLSMVCEAAHIRWHAYDGPDTVSNGLALEPTIHKLFDLGAWTLTDDRRILVSESFSGSPEAVQRLRDRHGQPISMPLNQKDVPSAEFIKWHREPTAGGVFRMPALEL